MRNSFVFILLSLWSPLASGSEVMEIPAFREHPDKVIRRCYDQAITATQKGKTLCTRQGWGDSWVCPASKEMRLKPLWQCNSEAKEAKDQPAMLYLLGLLHQDFRLQEDPQAPTCPRFYRYQEGSSICVYTNDHFNRVIEKFPDSKYADMAAFQRAEEEYRYYECEGQVLCRIENQITGWIDFLASRPRSPFAGHATNQIVAAFNELSGARLGPREQYPERLLEDIENLEKIAVKMSTENRERLGRSLNKAKPILIKIKDTKARHRP